MFIGMGFGFLLSGLYENAFIACMFIGMGLGFLLDSLFIVEERKIKVGKMCKAFSSALMLLGIVFVLAGISYLTNPYLIFALKNYLIALGFIAFGLFILLRGIEGIKPQK